MQELITMILNNGIGVVCVAYLIYFQSTTMKKISENQENNNIYGDTRNKKDVKLLSKIVSIIFILAILFIAAVSMFIKNAYENLEMQMDEMYYDIEYDLDSDGYLDYEEMSIYESEKAADYERFYTAEELFIDKEDMAIYFEIENRNS